MGFAEGRFFLSIFLIPKGYTLIKIYSRQI